MGPHTVGELLPQPLILQKTNSNSPQHCKLENIFGQIELHLEFRKFTWYLNACNIEQQPNKMKFILFIIWRHCAYISC